LQICLNTNSPLIYHQVLVCSIHRIITQKRLAWWPQVTMLYSKSHELRDLFLKTLNYVMHTGCMSQPTAIKMININIKERVGNPLKFATGKGGGGEEGAFQKHLLLCIVRLINADPLLMLNNQGKAGHEMQSSCRYRLLILHILQELFSCVNVFLPCSAATTLELISGLVSLLHPPSVADVAMEAMDALLTLHHPDKIEMWNPESPIHTFWDVSSQVLYSMSQKLTFKQHLIVNYTDILKWLRKILECRNQFLKRHKESANVGSQIALCKQAHLKLEVREC